MGVTIGDPTAGAGVDGSRAVVLEDVLRTPKSPRLPIRLSGKDKGGASKGKGPLLPTHDAFDPKKAPALHVGDDCILDIPDESSTMLSPVGLGEGLVQCDLERVWGGFGRGPWMTEHIGFRLYKAGTDELILSARKRGSEYLISAYTDENHDNNYCAVLRCAPYPLLGPVGKPRTHATLRCGLPCPPRRPHDSGWRLMTPPAF